MRTRTIVLTGMLAVGSWLLSSGGAQAYTIYGDSASSGNNPIHIIDSTTGVEQTRYIGQAGGNGRGVVTVGDTIYYTVVNDPHIYTMSATTGITFGSILTTNQSMSTLAWDGKTFWTADYSGTNRAFQIDPVTGLNIKTITLSQATGFMDGLEYFNGKLIGNRTDGGFGGPIVYDIYDLDGNLLQAAFLTQTNGTGIAFDGTNFLVSNVFGASIGVFDGVTGAFLHTIPLTSSFGSFTIEDLSVDYAQRPDTGAPEPGVFFLLGAGLAGLAWARRRN